MEKHMKNRFSPLLISKCKILLRNKMNHPKFKFKMWKSNDMLYSFKLWKEQNRQKELMFSFTCLKQTTTTFCPWS